MKKILVIILILLVIIYLSIFIFFSAFPRKYEEYICKYADEYNVDRYIIASVINVESSYDSNCVSSAGAIGLMQLLPSTADDMAIRLGIDIKSIDLKDAETNIMLGSYYLSYLLKMFDNNIYNALSAYNWGLSNVKNWIALGNVDDGGNITKVPVKETRDYLKKYEVNKFIYKNIYNYS